jgi:hypothetical protein
MAVIKQIVGTRISLAYTGTTLSTLASGTYTENTTAYDCTVNQPLDVLIEVDATTTNTPTGNTQLVVFISESLDGTNYRSGPTSGTTTTREPNLKFLGTMRITTASQPEIAQFSLVQVLGYVPAKFFVIIKNDLGVALTAGTVWTAEVSNSVA